MRLSGAASGRGTRAQEARIGELAARQHGVVARWQLLESGTASKVIDYRLATGRLRRLHRGVYLVGPTPPDRAPEMAAVLAGGPTAVLSHTSALHLWRLLRGEAPRPIHVTVPRGSQRPRHDVIVFHRSRTLTDNERTAVDGIPITTAERALVDAAGLLGSRELEHAITAAESEGLISAAHLAALPDRYPRRAGMSMLRELAQEPAHRHLTRSEAERRCLELLQAGGLPRPHANVPVGPYELDLFWPEAGVAIEIDGYAYHASRARFEGDRRKDAWLRARGIEVIRLTWRQITQNATATAVLVGQALALARAKRHGERPWA